MSTDVPCSLLIGVLLAFCLHYSSFDILFLNSPILLFHNFKKAYPYVSHHKYNNELV